MHATRNVMEEVQRWILSCREKKDSAVDIQVNYIEASRYAKGEGEKWAWMNEWKEGRKIMQKWMLGWVREKHIHTHIQCTK